MTDITTVGVCRLLMLAGLALLGTASVPRPDRVTRVLDGDTVLLSSEYLPPPLNGTLRLRLEGIDAPERGWRARCEEEAQRAEEARELGQQLVDDCHRDDACGVSVQPLGWDKYGGRVLGRLVLQRGRAAAACTSLGVAEALMAEGLAHAYSGVGSRPPWCSP